jgi:hypothetical protein
MIGSDWAAIVAAMRAGGYFDRVMAGGPELDRVKEYLLTLAGERPAVAPHPGQKPQYPCFPGLRHAPFHDPASHPGGVALEDHFEAIRGEALALREDVHLDYSMASRPPRSLRRPWTLLRRRAPARAWTVYPFFHMGVNLEAATSRCPKTLAVIESLPGLCAEYPWGDVVFSAQGPKSRLPPHHSVDNLRWRCHLALRIPEGCGIRVDTETRSWSEGRCLIFEDSFEHEVWNSSRARRIVLIVDFWHPDLTEVERRALTAGFRRAEVRRIFLRQRIQMTTSPETYLPQLEAALARPEDTELMREFWAR